MSKKHIYSLVLITFLFGVFSGAFEVQRAEAQLLTVYIRANGDVDPSWVPIQREGDVYTVTGDIIVDGDAPGMIIERDDMTLNGSGHLLSRFPLLVHVDGIVLTRRINVTITNLEVKGFWNGITLWNSSRNSIQGNNVTGNDVFGISLWNYSNHNTISENNVMANDYGIGLDLSSINEIRDNLIVANSQDGVILDAYSDHNIFSSNTVTDNGYGIELYDSSNNLISQNNLTRNTNYGLLLYYSSDNIVSGNNVTLSDIEGIFLSFSHFNHVNGNYIENTGNGLTVGHGSSNNSILENTIMHNNYGFQVISSSNNTFCQNRLINNTNQVASSDSKNTWDCGYPSGGNYWSDYEERYPSANELDGSGLWNTPYVIDGNNQDDYPIIPEYPSIGILLLFIATTLFIALIGKKID